MVILLGLLAVAFCGVLVDDARRNNVLPGKVDSKEIKALNGKEITMVNGQKAKITVKDGAVYINGAKAIITDIIAKNGVIHVIDTVITPSKGTM